MFINAPVLPPTPPLSDEATEHLQLADRIARAKPLNARTLDALPVGVRVWDDQIAYYESAMAHTGDYVMPAKLREQFTADRDALVRARDWLQSKIDAERAGR